MAMLIILIAAELAAVSVGGFMSVRTMSGLEGRLLNRLAEHYGHDPTSDIAFSHSLDFAQYKVHTFIAIPGRYKIHIFFSIYYLFQFNCCGIYGDGDYNETAWWRDGQFSGTKRHVPLTCCVLKNPDVRYSHQWNLLSIEFQRPNRPDIPFCPCRPTNNILTNNYWLIIYEYN